MLAGLLALGAGLWLLLPIQHAPGYTSTSLISTSAGAWAIVIALCPCVGIVVSMAGYRLWQHSRRRLGLALVWAGLAPAVVLSASFVVGPFFWPSALVGVAGCLTSTLHPYLRRGWTS